MQLITRGAVQHKNAYKCRATNIKYIFYDDCIEYQKDLNWR